MDKKKRRPGAATPGRQRKKRMQGKAGTSPHLHYTIGDSGVQSEFAVYELLKRSGPLAISHVDETKRRREIADRLGI